MGYLALEPLSHINVCRAAEWYVQQKMLTSANLRKQIPNAHSGLVVRIIAAALAKQPDAVLDINFAMECVQRRTLFFIDDERSEVIAATNDAIVNCAIFKASRSHDEPIRFTYVSKKLLVNVQEARLSRGECIIPILKVSISSVESKQHILTAHINKTHESVLSEVWYKHNMPDRGAS